MSFVKRRDKLPHFPDRILLPSGVKISPFCVGMVSDPETILLAYQSGINFFFVSADLHWPLYEPTRMGLSRLFLSHPESRQNVVVAVVSYMTQIEFCWHVYREVITAIKGLEYIDLLVAGGAYGHEFPRRLAAYERMKGQSHLGCKSIASTFHDRTAALDAMMTNSLDMVFIRYNADHAGAEADLFPSIPQGKPTPILFSFKSTSCYTHPEDLIRLGLTNDQWLPEITDYYRFVLTHHEVKGLLCSPCHPSEIHALALALQRGPLSEDECSYLKDLASLASGRARLIG